MVRSILVLAVLFTLASCDDGGDNNANNVNNVNNVNNTNNTNNLSNVTNNTNPCATVDCVDHATCNPENGQCECDDGFVLYDDACVNTLMVPCSDASPENATATVVDVEITWNADTGWTPPAECAWSCDEGYVIDDAGLSCETAPELPLPGFGDLSGDCGVLDTELVDSAPSYFLLTYDFGADVYDAGDYDQLTPGGQILATTANAGGSSGWSETFAYEVLARCELAALLKTETHVAYDPLTTGAITDMLLEIDGYKIGVSVVRAMTYPRDAVPALADVQTLLTRKLEDILESSDRVLPADAWVKQILSVMADSAAHEAVWRQAWESMDATLRADTILYVTVTNGADDPIYTNEI